jgi:hypothetical protein
LSFFCVVNFGRGFVRRNQIDFEIAEKENMIRRSGISLVDTVVATLLLGVWISITVFFISGLGPGSRSSVLQRDLRKVRSWIERCTRRNYSRLSAARGGSSESRLYVMASKIDAEADSDSTSGRYRRRPRVNRLGGRTKVGTDGVADDTGIAGRRLDTQT